MKTKHIILPVLAILFSASMAEAQNLNPVVKVTNDYRTSVGDFKKNSLQMEVPDSLSTFGYKFDYSVFDRDYRGGSYQFSPYRVFVAPDSPEERASKFYFRLGAGWTMHPEMDLEWTPVSNEKFSMDIFSHGNGYWGEWRGVDGSGYDLKDNSGMAFKWTGPRNETRLEGGYTGIFAKSDMNTAYNSGWARVSTESTPGSSSAFFYKFNLDYRYGNDSFSGCNSWEHNAKAKFSIGGIIAGRFKLALDADGSGSVNNFMGTSNFWGIYAGGLVPHAELVFGHAKFDLGARISYSDHVRYFPEVDLSYGFVPVHLTVYAKCTGGEDINSYWTAKNLNHSLYYSDAVGMRAMFPGTDFGYENLNASLGLRGRISKNFQYDLSGGFAMRENYLMDTALPETATANYYEAVVYRNYNMAYVKALLGWYSERFEADAELFANRMWLPEGMTDGTLKLPALQGSAKAVYNWNKRIYAGITCSGQTARSAADGSGYQVPGWVDLGVLAEYRFASRWSLWAKGGNLLGQDVRISTLRAVPGPYFTAGFCLVL